eukprot:TRINITY_DN2157_c0_g1_i1.p1 TRINITY_DN2157_c0_g1~~TRINITY_DN2157_c0_g1_i1.p1  ORF type:complete len:257 (+),score=48.87 TRINITY_DN2157_c0_g1_i1:82-852(+)
MKPWDGTMCTFKSKHGTYLRADPNGTVSLVSTPPDDYEWWNITVFEGKYIFRSFHYTYLSVIPNTKTPSLHIVCDTKMVCFNVIPYNNTKTKWIISNAQSPKEIYLGCQSDKVPIYKDAAGETERWTIDIIGAGSLTHGRKLYFKAQQTSYLSASKDKKFSLNKSADANELFTLDQKESVFNALKSSSGHYISANKDGTLSLVDSYKGDQEKFKLEFQTNIPRLSIKSTFGTYISTDGGIIKLATKIGPTETFYII